MENTFYKLYEPNEVLEFYCYFSNELKSLDVKHDSSENNNLNAINETDDYLSEYFERDLIEDLELGGINFQENETEEVKINRIKRNQKIVKKLKTAYDSKCQLCNESFKMDNGDEYCEAHHIVWLSNGGSLGPDNVLILCANHHRMFHYATNSLEIENLIDNRRKIKIGGKEFILKSKSFNFNM